MKSFRTELENPVVEEEILELGQKIALYKNGKIDEDRFKSLRLARGVYGQRQPGVQMVRIKIPYGSLNRKKLARIADVSDEYATGNLHVTTRQDIQLHFVSLDDTPELWEKLARDEVTMREACGNTVRNITGSHLAGVHPKEAFDISPYAQKTFEYLVRNPICQEMGRKFKISFSATEEDDYYSYIHDIGVIPVIQEIDGEEQRGFKVMIGGGLGAQPNHSEVAHEFLPTDQLIPFAESLIRVFDRYGERDRRHKARMKFLIKDLGRDGLMELASEQRKALPFQSYPIEGTEQSYEELQEIHSFDFSDESFKTWFEANVFTQKQEGYFSVGIKLHNGDISSNTSRDLIKVLEEINVDDIRTTIQQNLVLRFVKGSDVRKLYDALVELNLAEVGFEGLADIIACPGTDTCNLGIASSMGLATRLTDVLKKEYRHLAATKDIDIKISGCMNACGQHNLAAIGFQGMTIKVNKKVAPAAQVLLGGINEGNGNGKFADKVIKVPAKKADDALRYLLNDYYTNKNEGERYGEYYERLGKDYFYQLLKPLSDTTDFQEEWYQDWGREKDYVKAIGVGECAGVVVDLTITLIEEANERLEKAVKCMWQEKYSDAIYHAYTAYIHLAKSILIHTDEKLNTQSKIIKAFDKCYGNDFKWPANYSSFEELVLCMKENEPTEAFATAYLKNVDTIKEQVIEQHKVLTNE
ncbi:HEPN domain-containing protein [Membranihabitans maritimus]|uniref:HEPN domain-containing protein n=1 Tax=Membranihabitans maritimus TaxID=2904244 RepID=UPI001F3EF647|nr:HEPN domain-containing protein [Membranihabitans maritimus]